VGSCWVVVLVVKFGVDGLDPVNARLGADDPDPEFPACDELWTGAGLLLPPPPNTRLKNPGFDFCGVGCDWADVDGVEEEIKAGIGGMADGVGTSGWSESMLLYRFVLFIDCFDGFRLREAC
jgi:hypothetical protein